MRPSAGGRGADEAPAEWLVALAQMLPQVYVIDRFVVKEDAAGPDIGKMTPLMLAIYGKNVELSEMLLNAGANPNAIISPGLSLSP